MTESTLTVGPARWARMLWHVARADLLERLRGRGVLLAVVVSALVAYAVANGGIAVRLTTPIGPAEGVHDSPWIFGSMTLVAATWLCLGGFFLARGTVSRDTRSGVSQILGAANLSTSAYTLGKTASNAGVLLLLMSVFLAAALGMHALPGSRVVPDAAGLASFAGALVPTVLLIAALATLWDVVPVLRTGVGNVLWPLAWATTRWVFDAANPFLDWSGFGAVSTGMATGLAVARPDLSPSREAFIALLGRSHHAPAVSFAWQGVRWDGDLVLSRVLFVVIAVLCALVASLFVEFGAAASPAAVAARAARRPAVPGPAATIVADAVQAFTVVPATPPVLRYSPSFAVWGELRAMLRGRPWWWFAGTLAIVALGATATDRGAQSAVLMLAWIWPVLAWSGIGARQTEHGVAPLLYCVPRAMVRQLVAAWLAGALVALLLAAGVAARVALAGEGVFFASLLAGACFVPALALALGEWSGGAKSFEALYTGLWMLGPLYHTARLDFTGATPTDQPALRALAFFGCAAALYVAAVAGRRRAVSLAA